MKEYISSAKTVEEAIEQGLETLGASIGEVEVQVLEEGSKGLFGLFGSRMARVKLSVKTEEEDPLGDLMLEGEKKTAQKKAEKKPESGKERKPEPKAETRAEKKAEPKAETRAEKKAETWPEKQPQAEPAAEHREEPKSRRKDEDRKPEAESAEKPEAEGRDEKPAIQKLEKPEVTMIAPDALDPESPAGRAHTFLKELTHLMGVDVTIDMGTDAEGNVYGYMNGDTLGILIGRRGETLDAVQYLTSLRVNRDQENYTRVTLDTENYRAKREDTLIRLANRMANRALRTGRRVSLEPMNPYERRIIHYALQQHEGVTTHSEGDEPNRHVVITVKK